MKDRALNGKQCARYLSLFGLTLFRNERGSQKRWSTATPDSRIIQFSDLRQAQNHWDLVAKQCAYYLARSQALILAAESLDERGQKEFNAWIDGTQHSLPDEMFKKNVDICSEHSTKSWEVEARRLAKIHGSIADATFNAMLKQVRQERREQLQHDYQKSQS